PVINSTTLAFIGNQDPNQNQHTTVVFAGNYVLVAAGDDSHTVTVTGSAGLGILGVGLGISVPVVSITKMTEAYIGNGADVSRRPRGEERDGRAHPAPAATVRPHADGRGRHDQQNNQSGI